MMSIHQDEFDTRLRHCHAQSLDHLSPRVQAQLSLRRRASATHSRTGWITAISITAALVLVIGLQLRRQPDHFNPPASAGHRPAIASARVSTSATEPDDGSAYAAYDENPDFYLWLASSDAATLALE